MDAKGWIIRILAICSVTTALCCIIIVSVDPYFHYHAPLKNIPYKLTDTNCRNINDGIMRHFDYKTAIIGSSMVENFRTSECDVMFNTNTIKVPFYGASWREIAQNEKRMLQYQKVKKVIRGVDYNGIIGDADSMSYSNLPEYLYDNNYLNDINYIMNRDTLINMVPCVISMFKGETKMTSFDDYCSFGKDAEFGKIAVRKTISYNTIHDVDRHLIDHSMLKRNITENLISVAINNPDTEFVYFLTPYSIFWWDDLNRHNEINKYIDAEKEMIEMVLEVPNIRLFSFNDDYDLVTNLDNYMDAVHYGSWINTEILRRISLNEGLLTRDNYNEYLIRERSIYLNYPYYSLWDEE